MRQKTYPSKRNLIAKRCLQIIFLILFLCSGDRTVAQVATGYTFSQTTSAYSAISAAPIAGIPNGWDDDIGNTITLPFTFTFNGTPYTTIRVSSNGFLVFGSTAPSTTNYNPISGTDGPGVISVFGRDLISITGAANRCQGASTGTAPNRTYVVQWVNAHRYDLGSVAGDVLNFQIRLNEANGVASNQTVEIKFGSCTTTTTTPYTCEVGLRGTTNADFLNRTNTTSWATTSAGGSNVASCTSSNTIMPASGLTFVYTPVVPACALPTALTATGVTGSGATVSWTAAVPAPAGGYQYVVSTVNATPAGAGTATASTSAAVSLSPNTAYYLFVRSICGGVNGNSSWAGPYSFTTPCLSLTTVPYAQGFDAVGTIPSCWTTALVTSTTNWVTATDDGDFEFTPHTGAGMACKNYDGTASDALLISPPFNLNAQPAQGVRINVWIHRNDLSVNNDRVRFFVNTSPNTTGATLLIDVRPLITSAPAVPVSGWYNYIADVPLSFNAAANFFIIAEGNTTASTSSYSVGFDDFLLENQPSCNPPSNLGVSNLTSTSATISWTAPSPVPVNGYEYVVSTSNSTPAGSGTAAAGTSVNVSGLIQTTPYYLFVRAMCGGTSGNSTWAGPFAFTTPCPSITSIPYTQGFDVIGSIPSCWNTSVVSSTTTWEVDATDGDGIFTPHSGAGMAVKNWDGAASDAILVSPPFNLNSQPTQGVRINVWIYRNVNGVANDRVRFFVNTAPNTASATLLIDVHPLISATPVVALEGWYNYIADVPLSFNTQSAFYVIAEGTTTSSLSSYSVGFDDFVLQNQPSPCSGPPASSSTLSNTANPVCANATFILSLGTDYSLSTGVTYQWQSAPDVSGNPGTFTNIGAATNASYTTSQSTINWYRCNITCSNTGQSTLSSNLRVTTQICYCTPVYTSGCALDYISNFVLNTLSNNSGTTCSTSPAGYSVYGTTPSNLTTILTPGSSYTSTITVVTGNANGTGVAIWIDYNDNGVFDVSENNNNGATKFASNTTGTLVVNVPPNALPGQHRMRVVSARNTNSNVVGACTPGNAAGEAEDYTVTVADPTASSNSPVCAGDTLRLFAIPSGAASYTWSGPNGFSSSLQNPTIPNSTTAASGTYSVAIVIGSTTYTPTKSVTVRPAPAVSVSNNSPFCSGSHNLNLTSTAPTATSFTWSGPGGYSSASANPVITNAPNTASGNYKLKVSDSFGCSDSVITSVTIYALPVVGITVIGNSNLCTGQTTSDLQATGASSYLWNTTDNTSLITVSTAGTYTVTGTDVNGCINSQNQVITESPAPAAPVITPVGTVTICFNSSGPIPVNLTCTNYSTALLWSSSETTPTISVDYEDVFNVTYTDANGCYSTSSSVNAVYDAVAPLITCPGDITSCSASPALGSPLTSDNCSVASVTNDAPGVFPVGTTDVVWTVTDYNSNSATCVQHVTVQSPSTAPSGATSNASNGQICLGGNVILAVSGGTLGTGASWNWYDGGCGGVSVGSGVSITVTPASAGTHVYYVRAEGDCSNSPCASVTINVIASPPTGNVHYTASATDGCVSAPASVFSVNAISGAAFYRWTSAQAGVRFNGNPSPYETTVPTVNVSFVSLPAAGSSGWSICAFASNACGNSNTICTWVRAIVGKPTAINGSTIGCPGATGQAYSSAFEPGAANYQWSATGGIVITGNGSQSITVDFPGGFTSGTLSVHAQTSCGYNSADRAVTITRAPAIPGIITGPSYPCPNASSSYSVTAVPGAASYTWTTSVAGAVVTGTTATCSILFPAVIPAGSTVSVTANSSCPFSSAVRSKGIATGIPTIPVAINGPPMGQCGQTGVSYSISPVLNATAYSWSAVCGTIVGPNNLSAVTLDWPASFVSCSLTVSASNACGTGGSRTLVVAAVPALPPAISGTVVPCAGAVETYSTVGSAGTTDYAWTVPAGSTVIGGQGTNSLTMQWGSTSGNVTVRGSNACGNSAIRSLACTISCRQSQVVDVLEDLHAEVYPNPANDKLFVKFNGETSGKYTVSIADVLGQQVYFSEGQTAAGVNIEQLDISSITKGVYTVRFRTAQYEKAFKVVVD